MPPTPRSLFWLLLPPLLVGGHASGVESGHKNENAAYVERSLTERDRAFWSFVGPRAGTPPIPDQAPVDAFLLAALRQNGIEDFAPPAPAGVLLRRLCFDLIGLPPSPEEVAAFEDAFRRDAKGALAAAVDRLLASPRHGERWAQHWLDLARFAETDGFEFDAVRKEAWRYRDWVVAALNADLPYDRFVSLQIAGDLIEPGNPDTAVATGFLLAGPDMPDLNLPEERRHLVLNSLTGAIGGAFLGVTLECAECHDHKTDPFSQADFYRLRAVFEDFALPTKNNQSLPVVFPVGERQPAHLFLRGDFRRPGPELAPGVPPLLVPASFTERQDPPRLALARWMVSPDHPLTARVLVNRVWQHHFGQGLVTTPSDLGKLGERPSHPELLDWLAREFVARGWSLKWLHWEILLSRAWRQSSVRAGDDERWSLRLERDPDNRLLSRRVRLRLDGEAARDAMLAAAGKLNLQTGGPGVFPPLPPEVAVTLRQNQWPVSEDPRQHCRRSLYLFARRNLRYPLFEVLDRPDANQSCARRHVSTTAPQALTLLNDGLVHEMAAALADRTASLAPVAAVEEMFRLTLGRGPTPAESAQAAAFLEAQPRASLALALFNLNEFLYLD